MAVIGAIRQRVGLLVLIIALAILSFLLMDVFSGPGSQGGGPNIEAGTINGQTIDYGVYQDRLKGTMDQQRLANPNMSEVERAQIQQNTWDSYVKELLAKQEYEKLGIGVSTEEMEQLLIGDKPHRDIVNTPSFRNQETGNFDPQLVKQYLSTLRNPPEGANRQQIAESNAQWNRFTEYIQRDQQGQKYNDLLSKGFYVPAFMANMGNAFSSKKADMNYVMVPYTAINDTEVSYSDADLQSFLTANPNRFNQKAGSDIEYITYEITPSEQDRKLVQTEVNDLISNFSAASNDSTFIKLYSDVPYTGEYYTAGSFPPGTTNSSQILNAAVGQVSNSYQEGNSFKAYKVVDKTYIADSLELSHILIRLSPDLDEAAAKAKVEDLRSQALSGADFEELAVNNSADTQSEGGYLGWVRYGSPTGPAVYPTFKKAVFNNANVGSYTTVRTPQGWHLVKVNNATSQKPAVKVAFLSKEIYASDATIGAAYSKATAFAGENNSIDKFRSAAEAAGMQIRTAQNINNATVNIPGVGANDRLTSWAFAQNVGDVSPVFTFDKNYVVAAITAKHKEGQATVESFRNSLVPLVINQKKAEKIKGAIGASPDLNSVASQYGQTVGNYTGISLNSTPGQPDPLQREQQVKATALAMDANSGTKVVEGVNGVYVFNVSNVQEAPAADATAAQASQTTLLRSNIRNSALEALKNASDFKDERHVINGYN